MVCRCVCACALASRKACIEQTVVACVKACSAMAWLDALGAKVAAILQHCYYDQHLLGLAVVRSIQVLLDVFGGDVPQQAGWRVCCCDEIRRMPPASSILA